MTPPLTLNPSYPLCVDLDGTLILGDVTWLMWKGLFHRHPVKAICVLLKVIQGRGTFKYALMTMCDRYAPLCVKTLPYNLPFIHFLKRCKTEGMSIYLVTAADARIANQIAEEIGFFDGVMGSSPRHNLRAKAKADALIERFAQNQFHYAGNSKDDLKVWSVCCEKIAVNAPQSVLDQAKKQGIHFSYLFPH